MSRKTEISCNKKGRWGEKLEPIYESFIAIKWRLGVVKKNILSVEYTFVGIALCVHRENEYIIIEKVGTARQNFWTNANKINIRERTVGSQLKNGNGAVIFIADDHLEGLNKFIKFMNIPNYNFVLGPFQGRTESVWFWNYPRRTDSVGFWKWPTRTTSWSGDFICT